MRAAILPHSTEGWGLWAARVLSAVWAGFWVVFMLGSAIADGQPPVGLLRYAWPGVVFCAITVWAWRRERTGGAALVAAAAGAVFLFDLPHRAFTVWLAMIAPPLAAGVLLLATARPRSA
jgi:uncharacterized membrane protein